MWPSRFDFNKNECRGYLRRLELESYSNVLSTVRAQGGFSDTKIKLLKDLRDIFHISIERHRAEIRRVANDEHLCTIADVLTGANTAPEWNKEGRRTFPFLPRTAPITALSIVANDSAEVTNTLNEHIANSSNLKTPTNIYNEEAGGTIVTKDPLELKHFNKDNKKASSPQPPTSLSLTSTTKWGRNKNKFLQANNPNPLNKKIHQLYLRHTKSRLNNRKVYTKRGLGKGKAATTAAVTAITPPTTTNNQSAKKKDKVTKLPSTNYKRPAKQLKKAKKIRRTKNEKQKNIPVGMNPISSSNSIVSSLPSDVRSLIVNNNDVNPVVKIVYASQENAAEQTPPTPSFSSNNNLITESTPIIMYPESDSGVVSQNYDFSKMKFSPLDFNDTNEKNNFIVLNQPILGSNSVGCSESFQAKNIIHLPATSTEEIHSIPKETVEIPVAHPPPVAATTTSQITTINLPPKMPTKPFVITKTLVGTKPNLGKITLASFQSKGNVRIIKSPDGKVILKASDDFKANPNVTNLLKRNISSSSLKNMQFFASKSTNKQNLVLMPKIFNAAQTSKTKNLILNQTTIQPLQSEIPPSKLVNVLESKTIDTNIQLPFIVQSSDLDTKILNKRAKIEQLPSNIAIKIHDSSLSAFGKTTDKIINLKGQIPTIVAKSVKTPINSQISTTTGHIVQTDANIVNAIRSDVNRTDWENELDETVAPNKISAEQFLERHEMIEEVEGEEEDIVADYIMETGDEEM